MTAFARQCLLGVMLAATPAAAPAAPETRVPMAVLPGLPAAGDLVVSHRMAGIALNGFDPVSYFERSRPTAGKAEHELQHDGATWRFASAANRDAFMAAPDAFMPAFGGYDALAVAAGRPVAGLPQFFAVRDVRLFVFSTADTRDRFIASPDMATAAAQKWPAVKGQLAR